MMLNILAAMKLSESNIIEEIPEEKIARIMSIITTLFSNILHILSYVSLILGIIILTKYKDKKPFIIAIIAVIIATLAINISYGIGNKYYIIENNIALISLPISSLTSFIYSTIKLVKYKKSDKFRKEKNKNVRDD